ncbi:Alpha/Beta hydrolase protein [Haematococcus lacustris]
MATLLCAFVLALAWAPGHCASLARFTQRLRTSPILSSSPVNETVPRLGKLPYTSAGYVEVRSKKQQNAGRMFFVFFEAAQHADDTTPIILWLQGGPGCSSLFGMLYINGPCWVNEDDMSLRPNPGSWNRLFGMLFVEQPLGTGFSVPGDQGIPRTEVEVAADLYAGLNNWYRRYPHYQRRPLIVTGESYAGKYVPSLSHYILQATALHQGYLSKLQHPRDIGSEVGAPLFTLGGLAIGNGWTDAPTQQLVQGEVAWSMGLIDTEQRRQVDALSQQVVELLRSKAWTKARHLSDLANEIITNASASATLEDVRRNIGYDGTELVDRYLNQHAVRAHLGVSPPSMRWLSCSAEVDAVLGHDIMKSVKHLVVDLLAFHPVLLYQGQFDAECGVASNEAWIHALPWPGHLSFNTAPRTVWWVNQRPMGYLKRHANLWQLIVRNTGHMVPHDNPLYGQLMIERWIHEKVLRKEYKRQVSQEEEEAYIAARGPV